MVIARRYRTARSVGIAHLQGRGRQHRDRARRRRGSDRIRGRLDRTYQSSLYGWGTIRPGVYFGVLDLDGNFIAGPRLGVRDWFYRDKMRGGSNTGTQVKPGLTATEDGGVILSFVGGQSTTTDYEAKTSRARWCCRSLMLRATPRTIRARSSYIRGPLIIWKTQRGLVLLESSGNRAGFGASRSHLQLD